MSSGSGDASGSNCPCPGSIPLRCPEPLGAVPATFLDLPSGSPGCPDDPGDPGVGGAGSFLAILVAKDYDQGPFITYSWWRIQDTATPAIDYKQELPPQAGCPGYYPAYHEDNQDLPVWGGFQSGSGEAAGSGGGPGSGEESGSNIPCPDFPQGVPPHSVARLYKGKGNWYMIARTPYIDLFRRTNFFDENGIQAFRRYFDQNTGQWADGEEVRLVVPG